MQLHYNLLIQFLDPNLYYSVTEECETADSLANDMMDNNDILTIFSEETVKPSSLNHHPLNWHPASLTITRHWSHPCCGDKNHILLQWCAMAAAVCDTICTCPAQPPEVRSRTRSCRSTRKRSCSSGFRSPLLEQIEGTLEPQLSAVVLQSEKRS